TERRGLAELVATIDRTLDGAPPRRDLARPRLPIDRAFTMSGFGTVVTGTLLDGSFSAGDEVHIVPGERRARIRGIQTHKRPLAVGDRFVIRRPSPPETLGGGVIADASGERLRRGAASVASLERRTAPTPASRLLAALDAPRTADEAADRAGLGAEERDAAVAALVAGGRAVPLGDALLAREGYEALALRVERGLAQAHRRWPVRRGAPREELRSTLGLTPKRFNAL